MLFDHVDGFSIHLQKEGDEFLAYFVELPSVSAYGDTADEALKELNIAWEAMQQSYKKHHEPVKLLIPNEETIKAMQEARSGKLVRINKIENLLDELNKEDD